MPHKHPYNNCQYRATNSYDSATALAKSGFRVFPVFEPEGSACSCSRGTTCTSPGKHPRIKNGFKSATTDLDVISSWWTKWPGANIGLRAGDGLVVIDIDGAEGEREAQQLDLPPTLTAATGRGRHLYYAGNAKHRIGGLPGIDLQSEGSYVIAPPSMHASGVRYRWAEDSASALAPLPSSVYEALGRPRKPTRRSKPIGEIDKPGRTTFSEGERNNGLFRFACLLGSVGSAEDETHAALAARNEACCNPPLDATEVEQIALSAAQRAGVYLNDRELLELQMHPYTLATYLAIRARADHQGVCIASHQNLADAAGIGVARIKSTAIPELEAAGILHVERPGPFKLGRPRLANVYTLLPPRAGDSEEAADPAIVVS